MRRLPRWLAFALVAEAVAFAAIAVLLLDMGMHRRAALRDGVNRWGYRGPIVGRRQPREHRLVVVGGSAAFGYGRPFEETFPKYLERNVQQRWRVGFRGIPVSVVNLAAVPDDAASFSQTLRDYAYLDYDIVCFYDGYNSLTPALDERGWRQQSVFFRRAGYFPMLPFVTGGEPPIGRPRAVSAPATPGVARAVMPAVESRCGPTWDRYCEAMRAAVALVVESGRTAIVVTPPVLSVAHAGQQRAMAADLMDRFGSSPRFRYLDFGSLVDLRDRELSFDGVHLTARGHDRIADMLTGPVLQMLPQLP